VIYKGILGKSHNFGGQSVAGRPHFLAAPPAPGPFSTRSFPTAFYSFKDQCPYYGMVKSREKRGSLPLNPSTHLLLPHFSSKTLAHPPPIMDLFNTLSTTTPARKILPLKEASPTKVVSCALIASTDLHNDLDAAKEVTGGASMPSANMADRPAHSPGRPGMVCGQSVPQDEGGSPPTHQGSPVPEVVDLA
jgi:hypothetical protein